MDVKFLIDEKGKKKGVILTMKQWAEVEKGLDKLELFEEMKQGFKEMEKHRKSKHKTPSAKQLLAQL